MEDLPQYPGGMDAFYKYVTGEIKNLKEARTEGVEGRVYVQFVVEKDGSFSDVKTIKGIGAGCDREAVRVLQNASSFIPGSQRGKPVRVRMVMPLIFQLNRSNTNDDNTAQGLIDVEQVESLNNKLKVDAHYGHGEWTGTVYDEEGRGYHSGNRNHYRNRIRFRWQFQSKSR